MGWIFLLPKEYEQLGKLTVSGAGFIANFTLWRQSGYFDNAADTKPLLHLWSLGIEEQFYILWPFLVWLAFKARINLLIFTSIALAISFGLNVAFITENPIGSFYSPITRIWEMLLGATLAYYTSKNYANINLSIRNQNFSAVLGCISIFTGLALLNKNFLYPGWWALFPTFGTLLLLASPASFFNQKILSHRLLLGIGLISYPLYLWHWPLLSFARIITGSQPTPALTIIIIATSSILAIASYKLIEKPLKNIQAHWPLTGLLALLMITVGSVGYFVKDFNGVVNRFSVPELQIREGQYSCPGANPDEGMFCHFGNQNSDKLVVVLGDSHMGYLTNAINQTNGSKYRFIFLGHGGCFLPDSDGWGDRCVKMKAEVSRLAKNNQIYAIVQSQRWHVVGVDSKDALLKVVNQLQAYGAKKIIIAGSIPDVDYECEIATYYQIPFRENTCKKFSDSLKKVQHFEQMGKEINAPDNLRFIHPYQYVCNQEACSTIEGNFSLYHDKHHLSFDGSVKSMPDFARALSE